MKYCQRCVMPDTRPGTSIDENGICLACHNHANRKKIDWDKRWRELELVCVRYKATHSYNCAVAVSGGKDSHFLVKTLKLDMGMNPLLIRIGDGFGITDAGKHNIRNLSERFNCDMVQFDISFPIYRELTRQCFEKLGNFPFVDGSVYTLPVRIAQNYNIPVIFYGENPEYEFGEGGGDYPHADDHVAKNSNLMAELGVMQAVVYPSKITPLFMSYYVPWSGYGNYITAKKYGFRDLTGEWDREGHIEAYDQMDIIGWEVSHYLKYVKFGYGRATDIASRLIREGRMTRDEAVELVNTCDGKLDPKILNDFLDFTGYDLGRFLNIINSFRNKDIFESDKGGGWVKRKECVLA